MDRLGEKAPGVKIGTQLFTAAGPYAVQSAHNRGARVFLDLKFHDIPNTVAGAVREATRLRVFMLNVHASGGVAMMRAAAEAAEKAANEFGVTRPLVLGVTVLTSFDDNVLGRDLGIQESIEAHVLRLAKCAYEAGLDGCVASPHEVNILRKSFGPKWVIVTPGIRPADRDDDQVRTATPRAAIAAGADFVVVGRPITAAPDPPAAIRSILKEIRTAPTGSP